MRITTARKYSVFVVSKNKTSALFILSFVLRPFQDTLIITGFIGTLKKNKLLVYLFSTNILLYQKTNQTTKSERVISILCFFRSSTIYHTHIAEIYLCLELANLEAYKLHRSYIHIRVYICEFIYYVRMTCLYNRAR